jgi:DNA-binding Lrp family transcriptional regulator
MVTALVLLEVDRTNVNDVAEACAQMHEVSEVYSITGRYDIAVLIRTKDNETMADVVTHKMLSIDGIVKSETMVALRMYSRHDLERMFSL